VAVAVAVDTVTVLLAPETRLPETAVASEMPPLVTALSETQRLAAVLPVTLPLAMCLPHVDKRLAVPHPTRRELTKVHPPRALNLKADNCIKARSGQDL